MTAAVTFVVMVVAAVVVLAVVMIADGVGIIPEIVCQQGVHRRVRIAGGAAVESNAGLRERVARAAADAAADQHIHARALQKRRERAVAALERVGLGNRLEHMSNQMSGGQMQRVAIARALVNDPAVVLADEATGNLDTRTSFEILLFQELHAEGRTIIFVTHNPEIAQYSSRNIILRDGKIRADVVNDNIMSAAEKLATLPVNDDD